MDKLTLEGIAEIAYDANRRLNIVTGREYLTWDEISVEDRKMFVEGVRTQVANPDRTAEGIHDYWMEDRIANGWKYGPERDYKLKTHPSIIPFDDMTLLEKVKDTLFANLVKALVPLM